MTRWSWNRWKVDPRDTESLRAAIEVEHNVHFWGYDYKVTPRLVDQVFGDGKRRTL